MAESKDKLKGLWWRWKRKEWKSWLETQHSKTEDHGIRSHHFMANKWRKCGNSVRFRFLGLQNHTYADCSHEIKRHLLLGKKAMTNLGSIVKSRDITLLTKVCITKAVAFPPHVVMYRHESCTIKKAECWRLMLSNCGAGEDSWESLEQQGDETSQSQRKSTLNIHWKDWCWSWSSNILGTWCEGLTHWKRPWCWERLGAEGQGGDRGWDGWMASSTQWTWVWANSGRSWRTVKPVVLPFMRSDMTEQLNNTTTSTIQAWVLVPQSACHKQLPGGHRHGMRGQSNRSWCCNGLSHLPIQS